MAYFLINGLTTKEKFNLVITRLRNLNDTGMTVKSLTFDGATLNISMVKILGADLPFKHPNTQKDIP